MKMENSHLINIEASEQYSSRDELENTYNLINNVFDNMKLTMKKEFFNNLSLLDEIIHQNCHRKTGIKYIKPTRIRFSITAAATQVLTK